MKKFQRIRQEAKEIIGLAGDKSDELTEKLSEVEKTVEGIRNGCQVTTKKLGATLQGSGSTLEKHQKKLVLNSLAVGLMDSAEALGPHSLFGAVLKVVGEAEKETAAQLADYETVVSHDIISKLNEMLEEDMKKVDKTRKKLHSARLDMDTAKSKLRSMEHQSERATREYQLGKLDSMRTAVDEFTRKFEVCQDAYATAMFKFVSKEQQYTNKLIELVKLQVSLHKQAVASLEGRLPELEKKIEESQFRPIFGCPLEEHLRISKREVATVIEEGTAALRDGFMDTEGLFRLAASQAKIKFLRSAFDAGHWDLSGHDPHTIAGCIKLYFRELPEPLLTYELQSEWLAAAGIGDYDDRLQALQVVKEKLPEPNTTNFKYLLSFLLEFSQYQEVTKMNISNIAIVFGPNLLWPREENADSAGMVTDTALQRRLTEMFIKHCREFYPDVPEPPPPNLHRGKLSPPYMNSVPTSPNPTPMHTYTYVPLSLPGDAPPTPADGTPPRESTPPMKPKPFAESGMQSQTPPTTPKTEGSPPVAAARQTAPSVAPKPLPKPLPSGNPPSPKMKPAFQQSSPGPVPKPRRSIPNETSSSNPPVPPPFTRTSSSGSTSSGSIPATPSESTANSIADSERSLKTASLERNSERSLKTASLERHHSGLNSSIFSSLTSEDSNPYPPRPVPPTRAKKPKVPTPLSTPAPVATPAPVTTPLTTPDRKSASRSSRRPAPPPPMGGKKPSKEEVTSL